MKKILRYYNIIKGWGLEKVGAFEQPWTLGALRSPRTNCPWMLRAWGFASIINLSRFRITWKTHLFQRKEGRMTWDTGWCHTWARTRTEHQPSSLLPDYGLHVPSTSHSHCLLPALPAWTVSVSQNKPTFLTLSSLDILP